MVSTSTMDATVNEFSNFKRSRRVCCVSCPRSEASSSAPSIGLSSSSTNYGNLISVDDYTSYTVSGSLNESPSLVRETAKHNTSPSTQSQVSNKRSRGRSIAIGSCASESRTGTRHDMTASPPLSGRPIRGLCCGGCGDFPDLLRFEINENDRLEFVSELDQTSNQECTVPFFSPGPSQPPVFPFCTGEKHLQSTSSRMSSDFQYLKRLLQPEEINLPPGSLVSVSESPLTEIDSYQTVHQNRPTNYYDTPAPASCGREIGQLEFMYDVSKGPFDQNERGLRTHDYLQSRNAQEYLTKSQLELIDVRKPLQSDFKNAGIQFGVEQQYLVSRQIDEYDPQLSHMDGNSVTRATQPSYIPNVGSKTLPQVAPQPNCSGSGGSFCDEYANVSQQTDDDNLKTKYSSFGSELNIGEGDRKLENLRLLEASKMHSYQKGLEASNRAGASASNLIQFNMEHRSTCLQQVPTNETNCSREWTASSDPVVLRGDQRSHSHAGISRFGLTTIHEHMDMMHHTDKESTIVECFSYGPPAPVSKETKLATKNQIGNSISAENSIGLCCPAAVQSISSLRSYGSPTSFGRSALASGPLGKSCSGGRQAKHSCLQPELKNLPGLHNGVSNESNFQQSESLGAHNHSNLIENKHIPDQSNSVQLSDPTAGASTILQSGGNDGAVEYYEDPPTPRLIEYFESEKQPNEIQDIENIALLSDTSRATTSDMHQVLSAGTMPKGLPSVRGGDDIKPSDTAIFNLGNNLLSFKEVNTDLLLIKPPVPKVGPHSVPVAVHSTDSPCDNANSRVIIPTFNGIRRHSSVYSPAPRSEPLVCQFEAILGQQQRDRASSLSDCHKLAYPKKCTGGDIQSTSEACNLASSDVSYRSTPDDILINDKPGQLSLRHNRCKSPGSRYRVMSQPAAELTGRAVNIRSRSISQPAPCDSNRRISSPRRILGTSRGLVTVLKENVVSDSILRSELLQSKSLSERYGLENIREDQHGFYVLKRIEVPMIEEVVKTVHRKEVVEKLVEIKVPKIHFIDKPIDVPELRIVDKIVEVDHFQEKVVHKVLKQFVDRPVEVEKTVKIEKVIFVDQIKEVPGEIVEIPKAYEIQRKVIIPKYLDKEVPTVVAQSFWPRVVEADGSDERFCVDVDCRVYNFVTIHKDVFVPLVVRRPLMFSRLEFVHHPVHENLVPHEQFNALVRSLNPSLSLDNALDIFRFVKSTREAKGEYCDLGKFGMLPLGTGSGTSIVPLAPGFKATTGIKAGCPRPLVRTGVAASTTLCSSSNNEEMKAVQPKPMSLVHQDSCDEIEDMSKTYPLWHASLATGGRERGKSLESVRENGPIFMDSLQQENQIKTKFNEDPWETKFNEDPWETIATGYRKLPFGIVMRPGGSMSSLDSSNEKIIPQIWNISKLK